MCVFLLVINFRGMWIPVALWLSPNHRIVNLHLDGWTTKAHNNSPTRIVRIICPDRVVPCHLYPHYTTRFIAPLFIGFLSFHGPLESSALPRVVSWCRGHRRVPRLLSPISRRDPLLMRMGHRMFCRLILESCMICRVLVSNHVG